MLHLSSQPNQVLPQYKQTPCIFIFLRTIERNVAYGCHTELARFNLLIVARWGDCLTAKFLMRFIDLNWNTNISHKYLMRVNDILSWGSQLSTKDTNETIQPSSLYTLFAYFLAFHLYIFSHFCFLFPLINI